MLKSKDCARTLPEVHQSLSVMIVFVWRANNDCVHVTPLEEPHCFLTAVITELITKIITRANYINFHQNRISVP